VETVYGMRGEKKRGRDKKELRKGKKWGNPGEWKRGGKKKRWGGRTLHTHEVKTRGKRKKRQARPKKRYSGNAAREIT